MLLDVLNEPPDWGAVAVPAFPVHAATVWLPILLDVMNEPPLWGAVAVAALPVVFWFRVGNVQFVRVPEAGVPSAPPFTTGAPAEPTFTAKAVATPVPSPDTPVEIGSPVALVNTPEAGVPKAGVVIVGLVRVAVAIVGEMRCVFCWATFVPSLHTAMTLPAGMATPVPAAVVFPVTVELYIVAT